MQLTNIARDVGEDARAGRVYLPLRWLREVGYRPRGLPRAIRGRARRCSDVVARLLGRRGRALRAGAFRRRRLAAGIAGPRFSPPRASTPRSGAKSSALRHDSIRRRARVSGARKLALLAARRRRLPLAQGRRSCAAAARRVASSSTPSSRRRSVRARPVRERLEPQVGRVLEMFMRLERAEQFGK